MPQICAGKLTCMALHVVKRGEGEVPLIMVLNTVLYLVFATLNFCDFRLWTGFSTFKFRNSEILLRLELTKYLYTGVRAMLLSSRKSRKLPCGEYLVSYCTIIILYYSIILITVFYSYFGNLRLPSPVFHFKIFSCSDNYFGPVRALFKD